MLEFYPTDQDNQYQIIAPTVRWGPAVQIRIRALPKYQSRNRHPHHQINISFTTSSSCSEHIQITFSIMSGCSDSEKESRQLWPPDAISSYTMWLPASPIRKREIPSLSDDHTDGRFLSILLFSQWSSASSLLQDYPGVILIRPLSNPLPAAFLAIRIKEHIPADADCPRTNIQRFRLPMNWILMTVAPSFK